MEICDTDQDDLENGDAESDAIKIGNQGKRQSRSFRVV